MAFKDRLLLVSSVLKPRRAPDGHRFEENWSPGVHCQQWALIAIVVLAFSGCQKPDEITRYTVAKPPPREGKPAAVESTLPKANIAANVATEDAGDGQHQLLGAIIPHGKTTWFFKLTGPSVAVSTQMQSFAQFLGSIKFADKGAPEWALPEGWEDEPGSQMRFATIRITTAEGPLEMSVIPLPTGDGSFDAYLLSNVNRWRGQFGLASIAQDQLAEHARKIELGETMWLVKFEGRMKPSDMGMTPPTAKASAPRKPKAVATAGRAAAAPFDCEIPEGWTAGQAGQFQLAVYEVHEGDRQVTISVSIAAGDLAANVNRWRQQVQLAPLDAADLDKETHKIKVDGQEGTYVEAIGPESAKSRETILGVIVDAQGQQWFLKLKGDSELAAREKPHFEKFVQSIRFRGK